MLKEYKVVYREENGEMDQMIVKAENKLDAMFAANKSRIVALYEIETELDREFLRFDKFDITVVAEDKSKLYSDIYVDENGNHVQKRLIEGNLYFDFMLRVYDENGKYVMDGVM